MQGARSLKSNKRVDGLYVFVAPSSLDDLEKVQRSR